jgi:hypothetical protein
MQVPDFAVPPPLMDNFRLRACMCTAVRASKQLNVCCYGSPRAKGYGISLRSREPLARFIGRTVWRSLIKIKKNN